MLIAWIEQRYQLVSHWIFGSDVRAIEPIAVETRPRQVLVRRGAAVLFGDDVVGLVREKRIFLRQQAVLAMTRGTLLYATAQAGRNVS